MSHNTTPTPRTGHTITDEARAVYAAAMTVKETGGAVEIAGVRIEPCDTYGQTDTTRAAARAVPDCGHPNHGASDHDCAPFRAVSADQGVGGARVVPADLSSACAQGVCPAGCSHLRWVCDRCSSEGGWGAVRPTVERLAAEHVCPAVPADHPATTDDAVDRLAHSKDMRVYGDYGAGWRDGVKAAAGLLVTARPEGDA